MQLRPYQTKAINMLYDWFNNNQTGNPVLNMPGGSGKSVVIAAIVKDAIKSWPSTSVLMLVHSKELIQQNANKLRQLWPNAPLGVYSASLNRKELDQITYAGIGSIHRKAKELGHIDLCLVDEAHAISNTESGTYRKLLKELSEINPNMRVIGFSASPFRLGQGLLTEGEEALFTDIIEPVSIQELVNLKHLYPLRSKFTSYRLSAEGLHKRGGDYIASEMELKFNTDDANNHIVKEVIERAKDYKHWLVFCSGISHAENISNIFNEAGISSKALTGNNTKSEREQILKDFESGKIRALCNVSILTTGYDFPDLDCIVMLRATMSPALYLQMSVRGMRPKAHIDHCLFLDFAGVIHEHGAITEVRTPKKGSSGEGEAPIKSCDVCFELVHPSVMICPCCGTEFPKPEAKSLELHNDCIMGGGTELIVKSWFWQKHTGKTSNVDMLKLTYYGDLSDTPITEYLTIMHDSYAGTKARTLLATIARNAQVELNYNEADLIDIAQIMNNGKHPNLIEYKKNGKFYNVVNREWI